MPDWFENSPNNHPEVVPVSEKAPYHSEIGVGSVHITPKAIEYVLDTLQKKRLSYGPYSEKFETLFAQLHQAKYASVCNSGTSALQVAVHALKEYYGWKDGDEVIVPATTFVSTVNVILQNNLVPKFVDVDQDYYDIDYKKIEKAITPRTKAIMIVHLFGQPANMTEIAPIAQKHKLKIIEDSCETMFAVHDGKPVGSWGEVSCFSTYAAHLVTTGVGGIAMTNNPKLAALIISLFNHGRDNIYIKIDDDDATENPNFKLILHGRFKFEHLGYSYRMTEMEAAVGLAQLENYQEIILPRQNNAAYLNERLTSLGLDRIFSLPKTRENSTHSFMVYPLVIRDKLIKLDDLLLFLERHNIETRYFLPLINQPVYKNLKIKTEKFPISDYLNHYGFYLGCHQDLTKDDLDYIVNTISSYIITSYADQKQNP